MLEAEEFELAIYRWIKAAGTSRSVNVPDFYNMPGSHGEYGLVTERLKDLHDKGYVLLSKISDNHSVPFNKFVPMHPENNFWGGGFVIEIAPGGRKFFQALEAKEQQEEESKEARQASTVSAKTVTAQPTDFTQLPGKSHLLDEIQRRLDGRELLAAIFVDLDGFKAVNDTLGHDEGDNCLNRIVHIIDVSIAGKGTLYRPGGDEFVVSLPNFNRYEAAATGERIRAAIDAQNPGGNLKVTASIGVTDSASSRAVDAKAIFNAADAAMYKAKDTKNCVVVDSGSEPAGARAPKQPSTVYGVSPDLYVGARVHVLNPEPGLPREQWLTDSLIWVIREINPARKTAKATPAIQPVDGSPTPSVEGPMNGPESPFLRTAVAG